MSRKLNDKQIEILKTVLRFRYVTTDNLASYRNTTQNTAYSTLEILRNSGYLGKIHDKSYRLLNKSSRYYLTPKAVAYLRSPVDIGLPEAIWRSRMGDSSRSSYFIDLQVAIHEAYNVLCKLLGEYTQIKTALELYGDEGIIKPLPSLLVEQNSGNSFFIELTDGEHLFLVKKRIRKYIENYDANKWKWEKYPDVYFVRASTADRTNLRKYAEARMEEGYLAEDELSFYIVSTVERIII